VQHSATLRCSLKRVWAGAPLIAVFDEWEYSKVGWVAHPFPFRLQGAAFGKAKAKPKHKILRLRSPALEKTRGNPPALRTLDFEKWIHQLRNRRRHGSKNWKTNYLCVLRALRVHPGFWGYCSMPCWATAILSRVEFLTMYIISSA